MAETTGEAKKGTSVVENIGNLGWKMTNSTIASVMGMALDTLQSKLANGGRDEKVKFYWDYSQGGAVWNVLARTIVGGAVDSIAKEAVTQYKKLIGGTKADEKSAAMKAIDEEATRRHKEDQNKYGKFYVNDGKDSIKAYDFWGTVCEDALMLGIKVATPIKVSQSVNGGAKEKVLESSDHLVWYDTTALISLSSDKNLVLTQVAGRDYSRKELVSNGDLNFSVSGHIVSKFPDIYPDEEVQKLRQILQYKGIVEVNNEFLDQWGITKIVIKSFNFPSSEGGKAVQDYSFEAVGIQPDTEANVTEDTIINLDYQIAAATEENTSLAWKDVLSSQLENLKSLSVSAASQGLALAGGYLDKSMAKE